MLAALAQVVVVGGLAPVAHAATEQGFITGKVTDAATSAPIAGAEVCAINRNGIGPWGCDKTTTSGEYTDSVHETGTYQVRFSAPPGSAYVARVYYHGKYSESEAEAVPVVLGTTTSGIDAELPEGGHITGTVTNERTKAPIEAVEVCAREAAAECAMTNTHGEYTISGLPTGEYKVQFGFGYGGSLGEVFIAPEFYKNHLFVSSLAEADSVPVIAGKVTSGIDEELKEYSRIAGRVINSTTKAPIAGIHVYASGAYLLSATTNSNGEYTISHLADRSQEYHVSVEVPNNSGLNYFSQDYGGVSVPYGQTAVNIDAELREGGQITGKVADAVTKLPISKIQVCAYRIGAEGYECGSIAPDGDYRIPLLHTGEYWVEFYDPNHTYISQVYDDKTSRSNANPVSVVEASVTPEINAELVPEPPPALTWAGASAGSAFWSLGSNWEGGVAPVGGEAVGALTFPRLTNPACASATPTDACYLSFNNVRGLSAESVQVDDGNDYVIGGEEIAIGGGGLTASPAIGTSGEAGDVVEARLHLSASQTWHLAGRSGGLLGENGLLLAGDLTGPGSALTVELSAGPVLYLAEDDIEVGPVAIDGANTSAVAANGVVSLLGAKLDSTDGESVALSHVFFAGSGAVGRLMTSNADLAVGSPAEGLEATSAKFDSASYVEFNVTGEGTNAQSDYSQLVSHGAIELASSKIEVVVRKPSKTAACPTLLPGQTYTFVSTSGTLSGSFSNAPEHGAEVPIRFAQACPQKSQTMRIAYHESGTTQTVTGVVEEAAAKKKQEEEAALKKKREEETAAVAKKQEEQVAAAAKKKQEEAAAGAASAGGPVSTSVGVLGYTETSSSSAQIAALLGQELTPSGKAAKIATLLKTGGFTVTFKALEAGKAVIDWYQLPPGARPAKKTKAKPILLAAGQMTFSAAGTAKIKVKLTAAGKRLLKNAKSLKLAAKGTFTPVGKTPVIVTKAFTLTR